MDDTVTPADDSTIPQGARPVRWESAGRSHPGRVRAVNEDALLDRPEIGLWAVADGVGGESAGDRASRMVVEALGRVGEPTAAIAFLTEVRDNLQAANGLLRVEAAAAGSDRLIASTIVTLLVFGQHFACAWAGDSRLYLWRKGRLRQISRDHSEVQELIDCGMLTPREARGHPHSNIVTRAVGAESELVLEMVQDQFRPGDLFLLCSDGLTKELTDDEIAALLPVRPLARTADDLIEAALRHGGSDNVTVVLVEAMDASDG